MEILLSVNIPSCLVSMLSTLMLLTLTFFFLTNADVKDRLGNYLYNTIHYLFSYIYIYLNTIVILKHYQLLKVTHINFEKQNGNLIIVCKSLSCIRISATPWTVHGILQARIQKWVAISFSKPYNYPIKKNVITFFPLSIYTLVSST